MGTVKAVCISEQKGTQKVPVDEVILVEDFGIEGDAHAGKWHRQVSLLGFEKIEEFKARVLTGGTVRPGDPIEIVP